MTNHSTPEPGSRAVFQRAESWGDNAFDGSAMMEPMRNVLVLSLIIAMLYVAVPAQKAYDDAEAYAVYSALIRNYLAENKARKWELVIEHETRDYPDFAGGKKDPTGCVTAG